MEYEGKSASEPKSFLFLLSDSMTADAEMGALSEPTAIGK
jgi:hypothetical protein